MTNELIVRDLLSTMRKRICSGKSSDLDCCVLDFLRQLNLTYYEKFKTKEEIEDLRISGARLAFVLQEVKKAVKPGISTLELDTLAEKLIRDGGDTPPFKNYTPHGARSPFPAALCVSVNDEIVHGIPSKDRILMEGDIVSIDLGVTHNGMITDAALTVAVGEVSHEIEALIANTERSLYEGIKA